MVLLKVNRSCFLTLYNSVILFRIAAMSTPSNGLYSPQSSLVTQIFQIHSSPFGRDRLCCGLYMGPPLSGPKMILKVKNMQRSGTEAIRNQIQPSKPKREITKITNSQNTKSEQLYPKRWPISNPNRTKNNMNIRKVKRHRNSDTKTGNREPQQNYRLGTLGNELLCCGPSQMLRKR